MIKKGINIWSFPQNEKLEHVFRITKDAGFDGVELTLTYDGELNIKSKEKDVLKIKKLADNIGVKIPSFASIFAWHYSLSANDKKLRTQGLNYLKKQIEIAALLGADTVLVVPGFVGVDFDPALVVPGNIGVDFKESERVVAYTDVFERSTECLTKAIETAKECSIVIGVENVWNKFLLSPLEMKSYIESFGSEYIRFFFDVGNVMATGFPEQWIRILGKYIRKVHFKDYRRSVGTLDGFVDLLSGDVDYPLVYDELIKIGYDDYCIAEMTPAYKHYPYQTVYNASSAMDAILKRKKFI